MQKRVTIEEMCQAINKIRCYFARFSGNCDIAQLFRYFNLLLFSGST